jgi:predicted ester cyclase
MSIEHNVALVRRAVEEIWNRGALEVADVVFAADYVNHNGLIPDLVRGPEAIKISVTLYRTAFPDLQIMVEELIAEQDTVMLRWTAHSTPMAALTASPPRETRSTITGLTVIHLAGGQVVESWTHWDRMRVLERLGLIPPGGCRELR